MGLFTNMRKNRLERLKIKQEAKTERAMIRNQDDILLAQQGISNQQYKSAAIASVAASAGNLVSNVLGQGSYVDTTTMRQSYNVGEVFSMETGRSEISPLLIIVGAVVLIMMFRR